jgi:hypothetical protein
MIDNFFKDIEESKHIEYMILKSNTCKSLKSINDVLREDLKKGKKKEGKKVENVGKKVENVGKKVENVGKKVVKKEYTY